jgi:hypothetical protein
MKPGWKTTEFWITAAGLAGEIFTAIHDSQATTASGIGMIILGVVYTTLRTLLKAKKAS